MNRPILPIQLNPSNPPAHPLLDVVKPSLPSAPLTGLEPHFLHLVGELLRAHVEAHFLPPLRKAVIKDEVKCAGRLVHIEHHLEIVIEEVVERRISLHGRAPRPLYIDFRGVVI